MTLLLPGYALIAIGTMWGVETARVLQAGYRAGAGLLTGEGRHRTAGGDGGSRESSG